MLINSDTFTPRVVTRRYQQKPIVLSTNVAFDQWGDIFPNATCVVTAMAGRAAEHSAAIADIGVCTGKRGRARTWRQK